MTSRIKKCRKNPIYKVDSGAVNTSRENIERARFCYLSFIQACEDGKGGFCLTPYAESSPFALCFAIFGLHLLGARDELRSHSEYWTKKLVENLFLFRQQRESGRDLAIDKAFMQLLTFTLSSLSIIGWLKNNPLEEIVVPLLSHDVKSDLLKIGALNGASQSGNKAMFMAILLIHARDYLGLNTQERINTWVELHLNAMNERGFWGKSSGMTHLQFQNGYHQYEIFEYLRVRNQRALDAAAAVASLADREGHFAPYPGGGGCYDYDAVSILTARDIPQSSIQKDLLLTTLRTILSEQNGDGGFAESLQVMPRTSSRCLSFIRHVLAAHGPARRERLRYALVLMRPKHQKIHTHWSTYSREWSESDLWDSWFRMLTVARIECTLDPSAIGRWGFIDYPGIGFFKCSQGEGISTIQDGARSFK